MVMTKQKILICGATGFIGRNIAHRYENDDRYELHLIRNNRHEYPVKNAVWHQSDLRDPLQVDSVLKGMDIVIQAAATTSGAKDIINKPFIHVTDNAVMNSYLLRSVFEHQVKHFLFFSCTVMYPTSENPLKENDFNASEKIYERYFGVGNTKVYVEKMCEFYASISNTKFTAIRHSNIYGPHDKFDFDRSHVCGATISKVMRSTDKISVWGKGEEGRDLLYISDLLDFIDLVISKQQSGFKLYNCGAGKKITIMELVELIVKLSGKKLIIENDLSKPSLNTSLFLDCNQANKDLEWFPKIDLEQGIRATIDWWKNNIDPNTLMKKGD
jgi:GDP-L-fucose synthase